MVSIHRVPVIAYLIIRVIYFTFRFKRETCPAHQNTGIAKRLTRNERRNNILTLEYIQRIRVQHELSL